MKTFIAFFAIIGLLIVLWVLFNRIDFYITYRKIKKNEKLPNF